MDTYLSESASSRTVLRLAEQYKEAAVRLSEVTSKSNHIPQRLLALHSMELFLNALLLAKGVDHETIRALEHDLAERMRMASQAGLVLRKRTEAHLTSLSSCREYHVIRYAPELTGTISQVNRVMATLDELSQKVRKILKSRPCNRPIALTAFLDPTEAEPVAEILR